MSTPTADIFVTDYSANSIKVEGADTIHYEPQLRELGGSKNARLKGGKGWIFSAKRREQVEDLVARIRSGSEPRSDPLKSQTLVLLNKIDRDIKKLSLEDQKEVIEHMRKTFHLF
jgi:hypothetical protein